MLLDYAIVANYWWTKLYCKIEGKKKRKACHSEQLLTSAYIRGILGAAFFTGCKFSPHVSALQSFLLKAAVHAACWCAVAHGYDCWWDHWFILLFTKFQIKAEASIWVLYKSYYFFSSINERIFKTDCLIHFMYQSEWSGLPFSSCASYSAWWKTCRSYGSKMCSCFPPH